MSEEQKQTAVGKTARIINILLIEDNHDDAFLFQLGARATQATVSHVIDLEAAIAHLTSEPFPDLIVLDLVLPGMPVSKFLEWVCVNPEVHKIPIVILTGALRVPNEISSAVRKAFFKAGDLLKSRRTLVEIIGLAEPKSAL